MHGRAEERAAAVAVARAHGVPSLIAELRLTEAAAFARIEGRVDDPLRTSDATREVYLAQQTRWEPVRPGEGPHRVLDASRAPAELARAIAEGVPRAQTR
jgi:predicted kinase